MHVKVKSKLAIHSRGLVLAKETGALMNSKARARSPASSDGGIRHRGAQQTAHRGGCAKLFSRASEARPATTLRLLQPSRRPASSRNNTAVVIAQHGVELPPCIVQGAALAYGRPTGVNADDTKRPDNNRQRHEESAIWREEHTMEHHQRCGPHPLRYCSPMRAQVRHLASQTLPYSARDLCNGC